MLFLRLALASIIIPILGLASDKQNPDANRLFGDTEPIEIILQMDMQKVLEDESEDPEYSPAKLIQRLENNNILAFDIKIKSRGNTRRINSVCKFPLLKINFKKESTINTVFEGQDKIKMVTHCQESDEYQNYTNLEYLVYKSYNLLTDFSYRVRLVNITYQDIKQNYSDIQKTGFLIEDDDILEERIGGEITDKRIWSPDSCDQQSYDIFSLFQFMIGNTDWWIHTRHNVDILNLKNHRLIPIPFDFDYSGIINTPYAIPSAQLPIHSVKQRFFKGACKPFESYEETISIFNEKRTPIISLFENADFLDKRYRRNAQNYIEDFYEIINNQDKFSKYISQYCDFVNTPPDRANIQNEIRN